MGRSSSSQATLQRVKPSHYAHTSPALTEEAHGEEEKNKEQKSPHTPTL